MEGNTVYTDKINYPSILHVNINNVYSAINNGFSGDIQFSVLVKSLNKVIRTPITEDLKKISDELTEELAHIRNTIIYDSASLGYQPNMSRAHKEEIINQLSIPLTQGAVLEATQVILDQLNELELLLGTEKSRIGSEVVG